MLYQIVGNNIKPHFCSELLLANEIIENLEEKYPNEQYYLHQKHEDTLNLEYSNEKVNKLNKVYKLSNLRIVLKFNDIKYFESQLIQELNEDIQAFDNNFSKIYTNDFCVCLSSLQKEEMKNLIFAK